MQQSHQHRRVYWAASMLGVLLSAALFMPILLESEAQEDRSRQLTHTESSKQSDRRLALVIGNGAYTNAPRLKNPPNDATDMADALSKLGFSVEHGIDLSQRQMKAMIREFGQRLRGGGQGLFYFAGHGVQLKGRNYLIPVDAEIQSETDVEDQGVDANLVMGLMDEAGNGLNVVILDACRNNPFARSFRSATNGLAQIDAPTGTLIAYSTAPGRVARDGEGRNGAYTAELLKQMRVAGLGIEELLKRVRASLKEQTKGEQVPWESSSLVGDFYLNRSAGANQGAGNSTSNRQPGVTTNAPEVNPTAIELAYWETIKNSTDPEDFKAYLEKYPNGQFAALAKRRANPVKDKPANPSAENRTNGSAALAFEDNITYKGDILTYYYRTSAAQCQSDCAANQNCQGFTFIRAGGYQPNDPPMCYLITRITEAVSHSCCISGRKR